MVKQKLTFSWTQHSAYSGSLLTEDLSPIATSASTPISFSKDGRFVLNASFANDLQKKIGEKLQNLECDRFPLIRKIVFTKEGILIFRTQFKTWEITATRIQMAIKEVLKEEKIEVDFPNGY